MIRGLIHNDELLRALQFTNEMVAKGFSEDASSFKLFAD